MTTPEHNEQIAQRWFAAFNSHRLEDLLRLYDDQAQHFSPKLKIRQPETNGWVSGKAALRNWWQDAFDRLPDLHYEVLSAYRQRDKGIYGIHPPGTRGRRYESSRGAGN